jgi:hypothetical protein
VPHAEDRPLPALPPLVDPAEVAGLVVEATILRSVIRRLAENGGVPAPMLKAWVELRQQVATLCAVLRTERALAPREEDAVSATLARALEELGDVLELPE